MHIVSTEESNFYQKCLNLGRRLDGRLPNQMRQFELVAGKDVISTSNGSSRLYLPNQNLTVLVGIKADIISLVGRSENAPLISISIVSSLSKNQTPIEKEYLDKTISEITYAFQVMLDKYSKSSNLVLIPKKLAWSVYLDIYVNGHISYTSIDHLSYSIRAGLKSCVLPGVDINLNSMTNEYTFSIRKEVVKPFSDVQVPHLFVVGVHKGSSVLVDMDEKESSAVDSLALVQINEKAEVQEIRKIGR